MFCSFKNIQNKAKAPSEKFGLTEMVRILAIPKASMNKRDKIYTVKGSQKSKMLKISEYLYKGFIYQKQPHEAETREPYLHSMERACFVTYNGGHKKTYTILTVIG